jgi:uncharacterized protein involved in exopolysaccharide biosynthesis
MRILGTDALPDRPGFFAAPFGSSPTAVANRRRLLVFLAVFGLAAAIGLAWTFLRPEQFRASARLQITPGSSNLPVSGPAPAGVVPDLAKPFLFEVEVLTSHPVLDQVLTRLVRMGWERESFGPDPIPAMKRAIQITPAPGTNVVEIAATGTRPPLLAALVNTLMEVYADHIASAYRDSSGESQARADDEVRKLEADVVAKRRAVERFRLEHDIVSLEREENQVLARVRGQGASLNAANEKLAAAEGRLRSLQESAAAGKSVVRSRDNPTLANLEQRVSQAREELRELERTFTPDYLAIDPKVRGMRTRLAELEEQLKAQRAASGEAALAEAREEVSSARAAVRKIEQQIAADRQEVGQFTARFNEYKSLQEALAQLEGVLRDAVQRRSMLAATLRARAPSLQVLEPATTPREAWRPLYARDAALSLGAALALALLAMWIVELFNRPEPQPSVVIAQPVVPGLVLQAPEPRLVGAAAPPPALETRPPALVGYRGTPPRELGQAEVAALLAVADDTARIATVLLLAGVTPEEAVALERSDIDLKRRVIKIRGDSPREIELNDAVAARLPAGPARPGTKFLGAASGAELGTAELAAAILCAAHDASIERAVDVTPECLRHTYIAFLVRQGIRFAELTRIVGPLSAEALAEYSALAPAGTRLAAEEIERVFPALRAPPA